MSLVSEALETNSTRLTTALADFSAADFFVRPCPGANHALWQLGHLASSEAFMVNAAAPGKAGIISDSFKTCFAKDRVSIDDPSEFPVHSEVVEIWSNVRKATVTWVNSLSAEDVAQPGPEALRSYCPTVGHVALAFFDHMAMHWGQIQVIRRKLGKRLLM